MEKTYKFKLGEKIYCKNFKSSSFKQSGEISKLCVGCENRDPVVLKLKHYIIYDGEVNCLRFEEVKNNG